MFIWEFIISVVTTVMLYIYNLVGGNFGVAIILFTVLIRLATHPLMAAQIRSSTKMQELMGSKEWQNTQKKYKDDKEKLGAEQMRLYSENGISPFSSCLPTFIQLPILIALYQSITRSLGTSPLQLLQLGRNTFSFLDLIKSIPAVGQYLFIDASKLIPLHSQFLWMNLGQPEGVKLAFLPFAIPTLAIVVALTTFVQSKLTMPPSANPGDQSAQMNSMMSIYMPLLLGYFALTFASGLSVYFITSNVIGILQYAMLGRVNWKGLFGGKA
jgi:YidC/Oxa1 family membrane protein insertase